MWEKGDPNMGDAVHRGPYVKYQVSPDVTGRKKDWANRVPAEGNPDMESGYTGELPAQAQAWAGRELPGA